LIFEYLIGCEPQQLWNEWYTVQNWQHNTSTAVQQQQQTTWQRPPLNWYKCNVDAGFHHAVIKTSIGWCVRDQRGQCIVVGTTWYEGKCSILEGEAVALLHALREMEQRGGKWNKEAYHKLFLRQIQRVLLMLYNIFAVVARSLVQSLVTLIMYCY
jgi:hypothetical protein